MTSAEEPHARLVLLRHGQSEWNSANLFTGWVDVDLTEKGIIEARAAGELLKDEGMQLDVVSNISTSTRVLAALVVADGRRTPPTRWHVAHAPPH